MSVTWEKFVNPFRIGSDTGNIESLANLVTHDFTWITLGMDKAATLTWTSTTPFRINGAPETYYENEEVIAGTHQVLDDEGKQNIGMGVALLKDGKIFRYNHMIKLSK